MKISLVVVRTLETLAMIGITYTIVYSGNGVKSNISIIDFAFNFNIASHAKTYVLSTVIFGYALSLIGTALQRKDDEPKLRRFSLILALLGGMGFANEALRIFNGYSFQCLINLPVILVVVDWMMLIKINRSKTDPTQQDITQDIQVSQTTDA